MERWSERLTGRRLAAAFALALAAAAPAAGQSLQPGQPAPEIAGGPWINSPSLTTQALRGRVVLVEFWTYG